MKKQHIEYRIDIQRLETFCHCIDISLNELAINLDGCELKNSTEMLETLRVNCHHLIFGRTLLALLNYGCNPEYLLHNSESNYPFAANSTGKFFARRFYRSWRKKLIDTVDFILSDNIHENDYAVNILKEIISHSE